MIRRLEKTCQQTTLRSFTTYLLYQVRQLDQKTRPVAQARLPHTFDTMAQFSPLPTSTSSMGAILRFWAQMNHTHIAKRCPSARSTLRPGRTTNAHSKAFRPRMLFSTGPQEQLNHTNNNDMMRHALFGVMRSKSQSIMISSWDTSMQHRVGSEGTVTATGLTGQSPVVMLAERLGTRFVWSNVSLLPDLTKYLAPRS